MSSDCGNWKKTGSMIGGILKEIDVSVKDSVEKAWEELGIDPSKGSIMTMKNGVLFVKVPGSAQMQELWFRKDEIRGKLNSRLDNRIKDIRFRVGGY